MAWGASPLSSLVSLISRIDNFGGFLSVILFVNLTMLNFFSSTSVKVLSDGVADPRIIGILSI